jgi:hypothetical protein
VLLAAALIGALLGVVPGHPAAGPGLIASCALSGSNPAAAAGRAGAEGHLAGDVAWFALAMVLSITVAMLNARVPLVKILR